jgi:hypothetical protein
LGEEEWYSEGLLVGQAAKATFEKSLEAYERRQGAVSIRTLSSTRGDGDLQNT